MAGLQLKFTNGIESPMFQTHTVAGLNETGKYAVKSVEVDITKKIRRVSFKIRKTDKMMFAMKFIGEQGEKIVDL